MIISALNTTRWSNITTWEWWDKWDDTALQTQDSKFECWRSEVEHATFHYEWAGKKRFVSLKLEGQSEWVRNCELGFAKQAALTTAPGLRPIIYDVSPTLNQQSRLYWYTIIHLFQCSSEIILCGLWDVHPILFIPNWTDLLDKCWLSVSTPSATSA